MSEELSLDTLRQALGQILGTESGVAAVYLYGSRVAGRVLAILRDSRGDLDEVVEAIRRRFQQDLD